ncbi:MAG: alpha/beta hydrolase, partial [Tepidisphaeraceae bacterium]
MKIAARVPMAGCLFTLMSPCFGASLSSLLDQPAPTRVVTYKTVGDTALQMALFSPAERPPAKGRAAVVWIHGGAWTSGTRDAFYPHARYFQTRGCVGISIDYRLMRPQGGTALDSFADCKSAIRYLRAHAEALGIDPGRIAVAGDSAGGH